MDNLDYNYFCTSCPKSMEYRAANCFTNYRIKHYKSGEYITYKGTKTDELSIVVAGEVTTEVILEMGLAYTSKPHTAPYPIGAIALFSEENCYRADIKAATDCTVISVKKEDIEEQITNCKIFMRSYITYITTKIDIFVDHLNILTQKSLKAKLAFYIFSISHNKEFRFDKKLNSLATYLCVERPSLSRAISELVDSGMITYERGVGKILDSVALRNLLI